MRFLPLVWAGLWRRPVRSILTATCIAIAFVLMGLLQGVNAGFERAIVNAHGDLLTTRTRVRGGSAMPISALEEIRKMPGVRDVAPRAYFQGVDERHAETGFSALATNPDAFAHTNPGFLAEKRALDAIRRDRIGLLATPELLENLHWKVGDTVTVHSTSLKTDGSPDWVFHVSGVFRMKIPAYFAVIHYEYFDDGRAENRGTSEMFYVRIDDPRKAVATSAAIDGLFANSSHESRTMSRLAGAEMQMKQMGDVKFFTDVIMAAVLFTLAFLTGNTLRQSLQDRSREFAVLKAVGYSGRHVLSLAFAEALLLYLPPALLGLVLARLLAPLLQRDLGSILGGSIFVSPEVAVVGLLCAAALAFIGAAMPASSLSRTPVASALGKR